MDVIVLFMLACSCQVKDVVSIKVVAGAVKMGAREKRTRTKWLEANLTNY